VTEFFRANQLEGEGRELVSQSGIEPVDLPTLHGAQWSSAYPRRRATRQLRRQRSLDSGVAGSIDYLGLQIQSFGINRLDLEEPEQPDLEPN